MDQRFAKGQIYEADMGQFRPMSYQDACLFLTLYEANLGRRPLARIARELLGFAIAVHYEEDNIREFVAVAKSIAPTAGTNICLPKPLYSYDEAEQWMFIRDWAHDQGHEQAEERACAKILRLFYEQKAKLE